MLVWALRRFIIDVEDIQNREFAPGSQHAYWMLQLWLRSGLPYSANNVRCDCEWIRQPGRLDSRTTRGLWLHGIGSDMANFAAGAAEEANLSANRRVLHLGLLVKYPRDTAAYIVAPNSYQAFREQQHWRIDGFKLLPGQYLLNLDFADAKGERASLSFRVDVPSDTSPVRCEQIDSRYLR